VECTLFTAAATYTTRSLVFAGGELQVEVPGLPRHLVGPLCVVARLQSAEDLVRLTLLAEVLGRVHDSDFDRTLAVPYFPYARQDRVTERHRAFSLKPVALAVGALGFDRVAICDPHSDVTPALIDRVEVVDQAELVAAHPMLARLLHNGAATIVAPDAGAAKKAARVAAAFGLPLVVATKHRDTATGELGRPEVQGGADHLVDAMAVIVDDICDGGRTFLELAPVLRAAGATRVALYVTHGIFSRGLAPFAGVLDAIYTTDAFLSPEVLDPVFAGAGDDAAVPLYVHRLDFTPQGMVRHA
jgi:ribose-phosphate pyrophosphokinase